jgi:hypothetical protein
MIPSLVKDDFPAGTEFMVISSVAGIGLDRLKRRLWDVIQEQRRHEEEVER